LISLWIVRVPLATYLSGRMQKPEGIWYAMVISFAVGMMVSVIYYLSGRWKHALKGGPMADRGVFAGLDSGDPLPEGQVEFNKTPEVSE
ncbi:MAG TPA: hypothetical protein DCL60_09645, partial [Armatimonadetes bacterium]|nr:hypothetical protein [Armatimonadota bacterium]